MYVLDEGKLNCTVEKEGAEEPELVKVVDTGEVFGELTLLYGVPSFTSITARSNAVVFQLDRQVFNEVLF